MVKDPVFLRRLKYDRLQPEHLDQVVAIERSSFPTPWSKNAFNYEIKFNEFAHYLVALCEDNEVAGYAGMWVILDEAHVTNVAVHSKYRRLGLGLELMQKIMVWAAALGAKRMTLEVRPSNIPARTLYSNLGFEERGTRKEYYSDTGENAIIMWKDSLP